MPENEMRMNRCIYVHTLGVEIGREWYIHFVVPSCCMSSFLFFPFADVANNKTERESERTEKKPAREVENHP